MRELFTSRRNTERFWVNLSKQERVTLVSLNKKALQPKGLIMQGCCGAMAVWGRYKKQYANKLFTNLLFAKAVQCCVCTRLGERRSPFEAVSGHENTTAQFPCSEGSRCTAPSHCDTV